MTKSPNLKLGTPISFRPSSNERRKLKMMARRAKCPVSDILRRLVRQADLQLDGAKG